MARQSFAGGGGGGARAAQRVWRALPGLRPLLRWGTARFALLARLRTGRTSSPGARRDHEAAHRREGLHGRSRSRRLAGRGPRNRYLRGESERTRTRARRSRLQALPHWMWAQTVVSSISSSGWRPQRRAARGARSGRFYGLDLYSLYTSARPWLGYLDKVDTEAARRARHRVPCFEPSARTRLVRYAAASARPSRASRPSSSSWSSCAVAPRNSPTATGVSRATSSSTPSRTRGSSGTPRSITARCSAAASIRGTCATATWPRR